MIGQATRVARTLREMRELGAVGTTFRLRHEVGMRLHRLARSIVPERPPAVAFTSEPSIAWFRQTTPFSSPHEVRPAIAERVPRVDREALIGVARRAANGRILAFGRWEANYGNPLDWHLDPTTGRSWPREEPWSGVLRHEAEVGDVKMAWEAARFPQAYHLARAASLAPELAPELGHAFETQVRSFISNNPYGLGIHWNSGQEIALRLMAWTFAVGAFEALGVDLQPVVELLARYVYRSVVHIEKEIDYARHAVHNNHIVAEAVGLQLGGRLLDCPEAEGWERTAIEQLTYETGRQFKDDGGYVQNSHNYHRSVLHDFLWAWGLRRRAGQEVPREWLRVMERSLDFLYAHQNPSNGALPNYGANDGSLPSVLTTCAYKDYRPILQALSVVTRGERLYDAGPWDESVLWWCGASALDAPLRPHRRTTVSFVPSGYHVLRGDDEATFCSFRCGTLRDRFSQIDMLHLDVHWRGQNLLVDGGSYSYNGPQEWYRHFFRTESHNTVQVDGADQMLHWRRFKCLYWTPAELLELRDERDHVVCTGEHRGYERLADPVVHRRSVLMWKRGLWVVLDQLRAHGDHVARLHWLCADHRYRYDAGALDLQTPYGPFRVAVYDLGARPAIGDVVRGQELPPRGWLSRHYGERLPTPSLAVEAAGRSLGFLTILGPDAPTLERVGERYVVRAGAEALGFTIENGALRAVS